MSMRYPGGVISATVDTPNPPTASGVWDLETQMQAQGASNWPNLPGAPTSVTATAGVASAVVSFTAPTNAGIPASITGYIVTSSPGGITATGSSSPITVSGLTIGTSYTFTVQAINASGTGPASAASNSVTPVALYIEDVYSTYLYTGNGAAQGIVNSINLGPTPTNGTVLQLTGDTLADVAPLPNVLSFNSVTVNTGTKKYGTGSLAFTGSGSSTVSCEATDYNLDLGTGDFVIQFWVYMTANPSSQYIRLLWASDGGYNFTFTDSDQLLYFGTPGGSIATSKTKSYFMNTWNYVTAVRNGSTITVYINGVADGTLSYSGTMGIGSQNMFVIGGTYPFNTDYPFTGYIDDFRILKGSNGGYTSNFTPPTGPLPLDTSTAGKGGLVWLKTRNAATSHILTDTTRGSGYALATNNGNANSNLGSAGLNEFFSNGFGIGSNSNINTLNNTYASWTFAKQTKFFDVVTYTGDGTDDRVISHNLGSVPGCIIVKCTSNANTDWTVYHRSLGSLNSFLQINTTSATQTVTGTWGYSSPTSTTFNISASGGGGFGWNLNTSGYTYVAYLFAHDAGGFGASGTDNVISCGSYVGDGSDPGPTITLGYEPQWVLIKNTSRSGQWCMVDTMRGMSYSSYDAVLYSNLANAEANNGYYINPTATGFQLAGANQPGNSNWNYSGDTFIYIAIRRGPMKTPTTGTSVFKPVTRTGTGTTDTITSGFVVDSTFSKPYDQANQWGVWDRLRGPLIELVTNTTAAETSDAGSLTSFASNTGVGVGSDTGGASINYSGWNYATYFFSRAPGFFDEVCYTGTGSTQNITHNLGVAPQCVIVKRRDGSVNWQSYWEGAGATKTGSLNQNGSFAVSSGVWNDTAPTSSVFTVGTSTATNASGGTYVAYLFATVAGVSKVGSYTGTGTTNQINCGFTGGARFVLIKRTDSTGDWYVYDTARGIVSGNDPYLLMNSYAAQVDGTDYIDTYSAGFEISSTAPAGINANGGSYIYLAIA